MKADKRAMLAMPGYGLMSPSAGASFWRATSTPDNVCRAYREGSLLAATFNSLWCDALNHKLVAGEQLDYFAMQHSDVGAEDNWLDTLIDELESRDLDVLGVAVPIKDMRGLTSIALERPDKDPWRPLCRLSMAELFRLPETFTAEDTGHPLLLNTGLWVCRFDEKWITKNLHFTVNDAIIYDTGLRRFVPKCEPEDWNFSRQLNRLGLRIGVTRKVRVLHRGHWEFGNAEPWGNYQFDSEWARESVLPDDGFRFPHDIPGWLRLDEGRILAELSRDKRVLEVGSYCGLSTVCIAQTASAVESVDPHDGRGIKVAGNTFAAFVANLERYGVDRKVKTHICTTQQFVNRPRFGEDDVPFDMVFIDGSHDYQSVRSDIECVLPLVSQTGVIVFHDYHSASDPGVTQAVDEFVSEGAEILSIHDSLAVVRPPAVIPLEV